MLEEDNLMLVEPSRLLVILAIPATVFGSILGGFLLLMLWLAVQDREDALA